MNPQTLRSAGSRVKPDVIAVKIYVRSFTTTQLRTADSASSNDNGARRQLSGRERARAAASEIGELLRGGSTARSFQPSALPEKSKVIDIKTLPARGGSNFVKLPSSFRGRGGFGAQRDAQRGGHPSPPNGISGLTPRGGLSARGSGGPRGGLRGSRGGPRGARGGARGRRGGGGGTRGRRRFDAEEGYDKKKSGRAEDWERFFRPETQEEHDYYRARDYGLPEVFQPSITAESLLDFTPPLALGGSTPVKQSVVLDELGEAACNLTYTPNRWDMTQHMANKLAYKNAGICFFNNLTDQKEFVDAFKSTPEKKASASVKAIKGPKLESNAEKAVKEYILENAIKGNHTPPMFVETEPLKAAASAHAHNESYGVVQARKFDAKLASLIRRKSAAPAPARGAKA